MPEYSVVIGRDSRSGNFNTEGDREFNTESTESTEKKAGDESLLKTT